MESTGDEGIGVLAGVKVVYSATAIAGPFAAQFMADHGADVIWIERAGTPDPSRFSGSMLELDRRNQRTISLDVQHPEGREVFLKLIGNADIFIEASKGGQYERWGLTDDILWAVNPKLVIVHISGYGLTGVQKRVQSPSYDATAQAFSGLLQLNRQPDGPPMTAEPFVTDYITALFGCSSALAALHRATATGQGESIDLAQYEAAVRIGGLALMEHLNKGIVPERSDRRVAGWGAYMCSDGNYVFTALVGGLGLRAGLSVLGIDMGTEMFPKGMTSVLRDSEAGAIFESALHSFCSARTAEEAEDAFAAAGAPCSVVLSYDQALQDPHYVARETFTEWTNTEGTLIRGPNVVPRFKRNPGSVRRGLPSIGMDSEQILVELGYTPDEVRSLTENKVVTLNKG